MWHNRCKDDTPTNAIELAGLLVRTLGASVLEAPLGHQILLKTREHVLARPKI